MTPPSLLEEIRFGYGPRMGATLSPGGVEADRVLAQLTTDDPDARAWDQPPLVDRFALFAKYKVEKRTKAGIAPDTAAALKALRVGDESTFVGRPAFANTGFAERLVNMWSNRITVSNASGGVERYVLNFRDEAVRPHIAGRYADMLKATLWHTGMQFYLTQSNSFGPNSPSGLKRGRGLNENLAREFLELHSMRKGYTQTDVTELAKLLAGMASDEKGKRVDKNRVEPGKKTILGQTFTDDDPMSEINRLVDYVARRPETAQNVAFFTARHFIADDPPADLVTAMAKAYLDNDSDLPSTYRVLLQHPAANAPERQKLRSPQEYVVASLRATGMTNPEAAPAFAKLAKKTSLALAAMGQAPFKALRPDGWPEVAEGFMTPPMMAARIDWAVDLARRTGGRADPNIYVDAALGDTASDLLRSAVGGAEQRWEGLAVLLGSPEFSRR